MGQEVTHLSGDKPLGATGLAVRQRACRPLQRPSPGSRNRFQAANDGGNDSSHRISPDDVDRLRHELESRRIELADNEIKEARVQARRTDSGMIGLVISDEGIGFDPASLELAEAGGIGLFSVRERLEWVGGSLRLEAEPRIGTRAAIAAPQRPSFVPGKEELDGELDDVESAEHEMQELTMAGHRIRVLLADDHKIVREGLASLLTEEPDMEVVGQAADGQEAVELTVEIRPDVVLMDVTMPRLDGIEATRQIKSQMPSVRVIGLSMHEKEDMADAMRQAGAVAYLSKNGCCETLIGTIRGGQG